MKHDAPDAAQPDTPQVTASEALRRLAAGNQRFLRGESRFTGMRREVLADLARKQRPFATILGCSDSRVPPELVFDAVLGELFVIRVAGNVFSPEVAGSMQYAGAHLQTPLFVVLGHEGCGAVEAALKSRFEGVQHRSRIQILVDNLLPGLEGIDPSLPSEAQLAAAVEANVRWSVRQILDTPEGRMRFAEGQKKLVGAIYSLLTGRVQFLDGGE